MNAVRRHHLSALALWLMAPVVLLGLLRPWTIRPIEDAKVTAFDAGAFAQSVWPRVVQEATQTAADVSQLTVATGGAPGKARFIKGTGVVAAVDRQSRVGVIRVRVAGSPPATVAIQMGPVIRGTALRDASPFIEFSDFTNQSDFAAAANALNDHILRTVVGTIPLDTLVGRTMSFVGAMSKSPLREDGAIEIAPVQLALPEVGPT